MDKNILTKFGEIDCNGNMISKNCKIDFSKLKNGSLIHKDFNSLEPIGKFTEIIQTENELLVKGIVFEQGKELIEAGLKSGIMRLAPGGEITLNENNEITEFNIQEISLVVNNKL